MSYTADEFDRLASDLLALIPRLRAAAKRLRLRETLTRPAAWAKSSRVGTKETKMRNAPKKAAKTVAKKAMARKTPARKAPARAAAVKVAPIKRAPKTVRKAAKKATRRG